MKRTNLALGFPLSRSLLVCFTSMVDIRLRAARRLLSI